MANKRLRQGSRGCRKLGNNKEFCEKYRREHRREKNKIRKIKRHLKRHPNDAMSYKHIERLLKTI
jgi:hypothetical protein